ncbi:MAG: OmpA family protein [Bacteroidales bacterium]|nr:OmpA family protein [Bacteroidales bacterium]
MRIRWLLVSSFFSMLRAVSVVAQSSDNLVFNPSFEDYSACPERIEAIGIMRTVEGWWQPTAGSSDYFNACGGRECQVPRNKMGVQEAHSGVAYCGIYCSKEEYREYLQTELRQPLQGGRRYSVSFWVSLAEKSPHSVSSIGVFFSTERLSDTTWRILSHKRIVALEGGGEQVTYARCQPQVSNVASRQLDDAESWMEIRGEFVAEGGERYLTIGNFKPFNQSHVVATNRGNTVLPGAYYYIDDVEVRCVDCPDTVHQVQNDVPMAVGEVFTLRNILFETDKSDLLPQSFRELNLLVDIMKTHPDMRIEVQGHTDSHGTAEHNRLLSEARAKAVVDYLLRHGIDGRRLEWRGYGETQPVADNSTVEGRQNNRRVDCRVISVD